MGKGASIGNEATPTGWASRFQGGTAPTFGGFQQTDMIEEKIVQPKESEPPKIVKKEVQVEAVKPFESDTAQVWRKARATEYYPDEEGGTETSRPGVRGRSVPDETTVAVDPNEVPYGSIVEIKDSAGNTHIRYAHDTGSAVKKRTASRGELPILDLFTKKRGRGDLGNVTYRIVSPEEAKKRGFFS